MRLADGAPGAFTVALHMPGVERRSYIRGRARWMPDGRGVAFLDADAQGRTGVLVQDFRRGAAPSSPPRPIAGFEADLLTESFGISPDGRRITLATKDTASNLVLASGVPGVD